MRQRSGSYTKAEQSLQQAVDMLNKTVGCEDSEKEGHFILLPGTKRGFCVLRRNKDHGADVVFPKASIMITFASVTAFEQGFKAGAGTKK